MASVNRPDGSVLSDPVSLYGRSTPCPGESGLCAPYPWNSYLVRVDEPDGDRYVTVIRGEVLDRIGLARPPYVPGGRS